MVEAKPEDLRVHIEEAAGISKYKERRSETETRMQHTRENLERLDDLREEVEKQIKHLQKQAEKAEKYTELKKEERRYKLELLAMRWQTYHQAAQALENKLHTVAAEHNRLFVELRDLDTSIENKRAEHKAQQQHLDVAQGDFYGIVAQVSSLEQTIKHNELSHEETSKEISRLQQQAEQSQQQLEIDFQQLEEIKETLLETEESLIIAQERQEDFLHNQEDMQQQRSNWQKQWDEYRTTSAKYREQGEIQRVKISQLDNQNRQLQSRKDKLGEEHSQLASSQLREDIATLDSHIELIEEQRDELHNTLEQLHQEIGERRQQVKHHHDQLHSHRSEQHSVRGKITSLELLQQHAMGKDNKHLSAWLEQNQLTDSQRLAEIINVQSGWHNAVETVLGNYLEAICIDNADAVISALVQLSEDSISLLEKRDAQSGNSNPNAQRLLDKVSAPWSLSALLAGVYSTDSIEEARRLSLQLQAHESVITADGTWFGPGWIKIIRSKDSKTGVLQREQELRLLKQRQEELNLQIDEIEEQLESTETNLKHAEHQRESIQSQHNQLSSELSQKKSQVSAQAAHLEQQQRRLKQLSDELEDIQRASSDHAEQIAEAEMLLEQAETVSVSQEQQRQTLESLNQELQARQLNTEQTVNEARQQVYSLIAKIESLRSSESSTTKQIERLQLQHEQSLERIGELENKLHHTLTPLDDEKCRLEQLSLQKIQLEAELKTQRLLQTDIETAISQAAEQHTRVQRALENQKEALDKLRFELQESQVRQQTVNEQLKEIDADASLVLQTLPAHADEHSWKRTVDDLAGQIERLGTINLTAIEEYQAQSARMNFLNEQHADLIEALQMLEQAINQIDKESRLRFKETFDKINTGLQEKFPKLFGGGQAYLELTADDLLESGVNIIARPPGKRNSSIHLLSGGEKALTAVALVFSIFELNPAPFCLLDEVDAPLDDANVGRFSKMVEEMSASVQFLYISHNKATMEIAKQLAGVTMKEPGVSRMVAVDIEEAVSLAEI